MLDTPFRQYRQSGRDEEAMTPNVETIQCTSFLQLLLEKRQRVSEEEQSANGRGRGIEAALPGVPWQCGSSKGTSLEVRGDFKMRRLAFTFHSRCLKMEGLQINPPQWGVREPY